MTATAAGAAGIPTPTRARKDVAVYDLSASPGAVDSRQHAPRRHRNRCHPGRAGHLTHPLPPYRWRDPDGCRATGYGLAACLFTDTTWVPAAYTGAFLWGAAGSVFGAVAVTTLQQVASMHAHAGS